MKAFLSVSLIAGLNILLTSKGVNGQIESTKPMPAHAPLEVTAKNEEAIARLERSISQLMAAADVPGLSIALDGGFSQPRLPITSG